MGIDYSAKLMVGAHFDDLPEDIQEVDDIHEWIDENQLSYASEWYDAGKDGLIIGVALSAPPYPMTKEWLDELALAHTAAAFKLQVKPATIITPDIW